MAKRLRVIMAITLVALSVGLVMSGCSNDSEVDISGLMMITGCEAGSAADIELGGPAPDFWFETAQGQTTSLSDFRGKVVLVNFWTTGCVYCCMQMPFLQQVYDEWQEAGLVLLAINVGESSEKVAAFMRDNGFSFPVLLDEEGQVYIRYGVLGLPTTIFIDKEGLIQEGRIGAFSSKEEIESILRQLE